MLTDGERDRKRGKEIEREGTRERGVVEGDYNIIH